MHAGNPNARVVLLQITGYDDDGEGVVWDFMFRTFASDPRQAMRAAVHDFLSSAPGEEWLQDTGKDPEDFRWWDVSSCFEEIPWAAHGLELFEDCDNVDVDLRDLVFLPLPRSVATVGDR